MDQYENLLQLLFFHVLPSLDQWDEVFRLIEADVFLILWKKEAFKKHALEIKQKREKQIEQSTSTSSVDTEKKQQNSNVEQKNIEREDESKLLIRNTNDTTSQGTKLVKEFSLMDFVKKFFSNHRLFWSILTLISLAFVIGSYSSTRKKRIHKRIVIGRNVHREENVLWNIIKDLKETISSLFSMSSKRSTLL